MSKMTKIPCTNCVSGWHRSGKFIFICLKINHVWGISFNSNKHLVGEKVGSCRHWQTRLKKLGTGTVALGQSTCLACLRPWVQSPAWEEREVNLLGLSWVAEYLTNMSGVLGLILVLKKKTMARCSEELLQSQHLSAIDCWIQNGSQPGLLSSRTTEAS